MSETPSGSWQPDPYGRFTQRYWDGANWTANVTDASGAQHTDPPIPSAGAPATASTPSGSVLPVPGLVVAGIGVVLVVLSMFVLSWYEFDSDTKESLRESAADVQAELGLSADSLVDGVKLSEVRDIADKIGTEDLNIVTEQYINWAYLVAILAAVFAVIALFQPQLRSAALGAAVLFTLWHAWTVNDLGGETVETQFGAWLGAVGLAMAAVALLLPRPQAAT